MERLIWLFQFLFYFMQYHVGCSSSLSSFSSPTHHLCPYEERSALLQFKHTFTINSNVSLFCDYRGSPSYPKTMSWNETVTDDCCGWDGVTCDGLTGHVIGLDLSCSQLYGTIHPNSSLFQLSHLQHLSLAYNDFNYSRISSAFARFAATLTHLNLSTSYFSGSIPSEILHLSKLVSLDLSFEYGQLRLEPHIFKLMLKNLTQLQELVLSEVNISSVIPESLTNMSSLTYLDLFYTTLHGKLPDSIFHLPNLQTLILSDNPDLTVNLPKVNWSCSGSLRELDLSFTSFSKELPDSIGYLKSLNYLCLDYCHLSGSIPKSLGNLTQITQLCLSRNSFNGHIPFTLSNLNQLIYLDLSYNNLNGKIPNDFGKLIKLEALELRANNFNGQFPCWVANLTKLAGLDMSSNELKGPIPSNISRLQNLQWLDLSNNSLNGTLPSLMFTIPSLIELDLRTNRLTGQIPEFQHKSSLEFIDLSHNELHGPIPPSISNLVNLTVLYLSSNNLSGVVELHTLSNLKKFQDLDLSYNSLSVSTISNINNTLPNFWYFSMSSCKIEEFPDFLKALKNLELLDLSNNQIRGQIPKWVGVIGKASLSYLNLSHNLLTGIKQLPWKNLYILDLHSNLLQGQLPVPPLSTRYLLISHNKLSGEIPSSICNVSNLSIIDLSHNNLNGSIPRCLGYFSNSLSVLDLRSNSFMGNITLTCAKGNVLQNLNLNGNQFEGPVPESLTNCRQLQVLDLGNNMINDKFPNWLGTLPQLQVLVLRSNRFHGPIDTSKPNLPFPGLQSNKFDDPFPKLRIVDLSYNNFTGHFPWGYFRNIKVFKNKSTRGVQYMGRAYYQDSVALTMKGFEIEMVNILTIFTTIDLSWNKFFGEIPNVIGQLDSLVVLNLSHNSFTGSIPASLGDMTELESLDLSSNQLIGKIPSELKSLTFLEVFNLSWNHLDGHIPQGNQLDTFGNDSYVGNSGLCGFPLSKECKDKRAQLQPAEPFQQKNNLDFASGFTWKAVAIGYGCGMVLGLVIGYLMFLTKRPKWFVKIIEGEKHKKVRRLRQDGKRN